MDYKEKLDTHNRKRAENRVQQFSQSEVYRRDIRPWMMDRMTLARTMIYTPEYTEERIEGVAILGVVETFLEYVEGESWQKRWAKREPSHPETKREGLLKKVRKKLKL